MGNGPVPAASEPKFWRIVSVLSILIAAVAIVLSASFAQDFKAQQARADQAVQQLAGVTGERDQAKAKADEVAAQIGALTAERDTLKARADELVGKLAASGSETLKAKVEEQTRQLAAVTKDRDQFRAKVEELTAELAAAKTPPVTAGEQKGEKKPAHHESH
jgi:chromosome segregation ATPase